MAKVVAVGGVFFKARDTKALAAWYGKLGYVLDPEGNLLELWQQSDDDPYAK